LPSMRTNRRFAPLWMVPVTLAAVAGTSFAQTDAPAVLVIGATAPMRETRMTGVDGKEITLADAAGKKGTLVVFMCNHCPFVKAWQGRIAKVGNEAVLKVVGVVAVYWNDPAVYPAVDIDVLVARTRPMGVWMRTCG